MTEDDLAVLELAVLESAVGAAPTYRTALLALALVADHRELLAAARAVVEPSEAERQKFQECVLAPVAALRRLRSALEAT